MNDSGPPPVPHPPYEELRRAAGDDPIARRHLEELHGELSAERPDPKAVEAHASRLRGIGDLEARIATWWESPETQRWVKAIADANL
jgi:hypothetical protein